MAFTLSSKPVSGWFKRHAAGWVMAAVLSAGLGLAMPPLLDKAHPSWLERWRSPDTTLPGPVDIGFAQFMSVHHDQAVTMCQILLGHRQSTLGDVAMSILTAQAMEIGQMRGWLRLWNKPDTPTTRRMDWMLAGANPIKPAILDYVTVCNSKRGMPGMATVDELNRLRLTEGSAGDRLFLRLMIRHHQSGLPMAQVAAASGHIPAVQMLAAHIVFDQTSELNQMRGLLVELDAEAKDRAHQIPGH
jgi:uncharacterized protein (DUF305 family)